MNWKGFVHEEEDCQEGCLDDLIRTVVRLSLASA
jgi:hypothetical protein